MDFSKIDLSDHQKLAREIIEKASKENFKNRSAFERFRNAIVKKEKGVIFHNLYFIKAYSDLLAEGKIKPNESLLNLIQKRSIRTMSGVAPLTVMIKPFPCPGRCTYCPTDVRMPKSYLPSQPAAQRAYRQLFNPYTQVFVRLKALFMTGHEVSKVELRVIGGTWSSYKKTYQTWFLTQCLQAMNEFYDQLGLGKGDKMKDITHKHTIKSIYGDEEVNTVILKPLEKGNLSWANAVEKNETSPVKCIGINVETRPDCINEMEVKRLRYLGVTKVEIGVQTTDDEVQRLTKRGHDLESVRKATALLKDAGFKIGYHMMPNLPGSSVELDKRMVGELFEGDFYQPDYLKIYPCMVVPKSELFDIYNRGEFKPYDDKTLIEVLYEELKSVPEWCRIDRVARDIPAPDITAGSKMSNIRQIIEERLIKDGIPCKDIRSREVGNTKINPDDVELVVREYKASGGKEKFLSYEDVKQNKLIGLLRLRFPGKTFLPGLKGAAIVREVHVYGRQIAVGSVNKDEKQHIGLGTKLMMDAEKMAKEAGYKRLAVIAGIGTRGYYKKLGYRLISGYMCKNVV